MVRNSWEKIDLEMIEAYKIVIEDKKIVDNKFKTIDNMMDDIKESITLQKLIFKHTKEYKDITIYKACKFRLYK